MRYEHSCGELISEAAKTNTDLWQGNAIDGDRWKCSCGLTFCYVREGDYWTPIENSFFVIRIKVNR